MKKIYTLFLFGFIVSNVFSQQVLKSPFVAAADKCGFSAEMEKNRVRGFNDAAYEAEMQRLINEFKQLNNFGPPTTIYSVPIIFHVIYDGNTESTIGTGANLTQAIVTAQIQQLNADFANLSGSGYGSATDLGVRFVAAKVDPMGNLLCEPGIVRINWRSQSGWQNPSGLSSMNAVMTHFDNVVKPQSYWDPYRYVNIWLADFSGSGLLGYATFPAMSTLPGLGNSETDQTAGVVVMSGSVGSLSNPGTASPYQYGRTLTHELGHFFGLRHITGDANCGNDYCTDTPPQNALTSGCPAPGTANGCTPSVPKMFENYMDYSNDICLNTFTLNQSERCQVVMLNSPRRKELPSSTTGVSPMLNRIFFKPGQTTVSETASGACPRYKEYPITVGVESTANGNATLSLSKTGSATEITDYTITPSSVTYTNGDATDKVFTLRIYDDAIIESAETIQLAFNISGTGVQQSIACGSANQYTITITDDDFNYSINNTMPTVTLLSENFGITTGSNQVPAGWVTSNAAGTSTTNKWVGNNTGAGTYGFSGNTLHISNGNSTAVTNGTAAMAYSSTATGTDARAVTPLLNAAGLKDISVSLKLVSNGEIDSGTFYDFGLVYYTLNGTNYSVLTVLNNDVYLQGITSSTTLNINLPAGTIGTSNLRLMFRWISDNSVANQPPFAIDDVVVTGKNVTVESQLNHAATENILSTSGSSNFYSSNDGQVIAKLSNPSVSPGCLTATITQAGNTNISLSSTAATYLRSEKVVNISPAIANTTASYNVTLYYTTAELAIWGANFANLKLMKVKNGINLGGLINSADAEVVNAVIDDQRATKGYASFSGDFTGGFSQFLLVYQTSVVPVAILNFDALSNNKNIVLNWSTSIENNNKGFFVERSIDGNQFEPISWINGKMNSNIISHYTYTDNYVEPDVIYYYRLRQKDIDNNEKLSDVRQAKIKGKGNIFISISPNPASDVIAVFVSGMNSKANINLFDAKGALVKTWKSQNLSTGSASRLNIHGIANGVYTLSIANGKQTLTEKLIIR
ncbi:MAG: T9SS type A sorting domain-containing protein [Ferruginibacter sp.]|nr:T9SS type A sorting domain-containing protein [Ferruginibacter sp.]